MNQVKNASTDFNPRPEWVAENRSRMLRHIEQTNAATPRRVVTLTHVWTALSFIMPQKTVYAVVRPAVIFVLCFGVGIGGWITTVSASLNSLPGDTLYPVKLASEQTQVAVVSVLQGKTASAEFHVTLTNRRFEEVQKIVATPTTDEKAKSVRVEAAVQQLKTEVQSTSDSLVAAQKSNSSVPDLVAVAKVIETKADEMKQNLSSTAVHITSADASSDVLVAINQLKTDAANAQVAATSTPAIAAAPTSTPAITATSTPVVLPTSTSTTFSTTTAHVGNKVSSDATVVTTTTSEQDAILKNFPERPPELAPNVVDTATPITLEAWQ